MGSHDGTVDQGVFVVGLPGQVRKHLLPNSVGRPAAEPGMDCFPGTKALRQIPPGDARPITVQHGLDKEPVVLGGHADMALPARQPVLHPLPLVIPQRIAAHHRPTLLLNG
jgi:hypothetical protein